jgi:amidase
VTPTIARTPAPLGELDQDRAGLSAMEWTRQVFTYVPFTPLFNSTGQPAMSLPLHWTPDGLPVGVQFVGRFGDEATLIRLASQIEEARPWAGRRPPVHVGM